MSVEKRPWWASALIGAVAAGATVAGILIAHADKPVKPAMAAELDADRLARIESKVNEIGERVARIEGRMDRK